MKLKNFLLVLMIVQINLCVYPQGVNQYGRITTGMQTLNQSQRDLLASPSAGLMIWCSNCGLRGELQVYDGVNWINAIGNTATNAFTVPSLTTTHVSQITASSATTGGTVISDGGSAITARGVCWSTSPNPTIANSFSTDGSGSGSFSSSVTGTITPQTTYYVRAYATNAIGIAYGNEVSFMYFPVGLAYQGGKIFYIFGPSDPGYVAGETHGLIVADVIVAPSRAAWSTSSVVTGATANGFGAGATNTALILQNDPNAVAAKLCADLSIGGYDDWYLPSTVELSKLYTVYTQVTTGWNNWTYWSSTEESATNAARIRFFDGGYFSGVKTQTADSYVAAIRKF